MRRLALALLAAALAACGGPGGGEAGGGEQAAGAEPAAPAAPALTDQERQVRLAALPAPWNTADLANGQKEFGKCRSCHTLAEGGPNLTGPNLHGVFSRVSGSKPGFAYSEAMTAAAIQWTPATMDPYLAAPMQAMPGTKMSFVGIKDEADRRDLIAYLAVETQ